MKKVFFQSNSEPEEEVKPCGIYSGRWPSFSVQRLMETERKLQTDFNYCYEYLRVRDECGVDINAKAGCKDWKKISKDELKLVAYMIHDETLLDVMKSEGGIH